jgi:hypothetical protein
MTVAESLRSLDATWVDEVLRAGGHAHSKVIAVEVEPVAFSGATTDMARLRIGYAEPGAGPTSVIAKIRGASDVQRQMDSAIGLFEREGRFYEHFADQVPIAAPKCFHVGDGDTTPLLLEDLSLLRMGDQVIGISVTDAEALMINLAELHAAFWGSERLNEPWLLVHDSGLYPQLVTQLVSSGASVLRERYADHVSDKVVDDIVRAAPNWGEILHTVSQGPQTLVHNDCRLDNVFFAADGTPVLIDWQVLSRTRGIQDVANLLAGSMSSEDLAVHWERLVRMWHDRLTAAGVGGYSLDEAIDHYRQNVFFPLGAGMALLGEMDIGDGRGLGDAIVTRCLRHIEDVDAFAALEGR